jgi:hypothetical protein
VADDSRFVLEIEIDSSRAVLGAERLAATIAALNGTLDKSDKNLVAAERSLARFATNTGEAAVTQREAGNQTQLYNKYLYEQGRALGNVTTQLEVYKRAQAAATREARQASAASLSGNLSHIPANTAGGSGAPSLAAGSAFRQHR